MKKSLTLISLMLGVMLLMVGVVSADDPNLEGIDFVEPQAGDWISEVFDIEWTNDESFGPLALTYQEGSCSQTGTWVSLDSGIPFTQLTFPWDTEGVVDEEYCLRLHSSEEFVNTGIFCIDNTEPDAAVCVECCDSEGIESDEQTPETQTEVEIEFSDEAWFGEQRCDSCHPSCAIDWGDGTEGNCHAYCEFYENDREYEADCEYQYGDNGVYEVTLTVEDCAGNTAEASNYVEVENVDPVCDEIDGPNEAIIGMQVCFEGYSSDVNADEEALLEHFWLFDSEDDFTVDADENGESEVCYTWEFASEHTVELTVEDKDGGVSETCLHEVEVHEPIPLDDQEVAAYYPLQADFGEDAGTDDQYGGSFLTGITGISGNDCEIIVGPENLRTRSFVDGECRVRWDNDKPPRGGLTENPANDEQGVHQVIIKVSNNTETKYFEFTITVWSWIIELEKGWNLISIPYVPEDEDIDEVILDQLDDVLAGGSEYVVYSYQFDGEESKWLKSKKNKAGDLDTVSPGYAYWIKVKEDAKLRGNGKQLRYVSPGMPPEIEVPTNSWAMIGRYGILGEDGPFEGETCWDAGGISKRTALESLTKEDNELHVFDITTNDHLNEVHKLFNNQGYWLWVEDEAFNNADSESYAPLDKYYREDLWCGRHCGHHFW